MITKVKDLARVALNRVRAYSPNLDIRANRLQLLSDRFPDPDFELFGLMDRPGGVVVDAGANRGHCALAILSTTSHLSVVAFEPNPALRAPLEWLRRKYPGRFEYHLCGLGSSDGLRDLVVPTAGATQATTNATIRGSEFDKDYVQERLAEELATDFTNIEFPTRTVELRALDRFALDPIAIKIDVEGFEKEVLDGAQGTISRSRPMLMIEMNNHMEFFPFLQSMGYRLYRYEPTDKRLLRISGEEVFLNVIALHPDRPLLPAGVIDEGVV